LSARGRLIHVSETDGNSGLVGCGCDGGGGLTRVQEEVSFVSYLKNVSVDNRSQLFLGEKKIFL